MPKKMYARGIRTCHRVNFYLHPDSFALVNAIRAKYEAIVGRSLSMSLFVPRALQALDAALDSMANTMTTEEVATVEREALKRLCP